MYTGVRFCVVIAMCCLSACNATTADRDGAKAQELTVGVVQREIAEGMDVVDVIDVLGSPNIVKKSSNGGEVWVYDKFSTEQITNTISGGLAVLTGDATSGITASGGYKKSSSKALTVIIKFNKNNKVNSLAYHRSKY